MFQSPGDMNSRFWQFIYNFLTGKYLTCHHPVVWNTLPRVTSSCMVITLPRVTGKLLESRNHGSHLHPSRPSDGPELLVARVVAMPCPAVCQLSALSRGLFHILGAV